MTSLKLQPTFFKMDRLLRQLIGPHISLNLQPGTDLWQIKANPSQLEQVLLNLVVNARDAMPNGGVLTITTRNTRLEKTSMHGGADDAMGEHVLLMISDTGGWCCTEHSTETACHSPPSEWIARWRGQWRGCFVGVVAAQAHKAQQCDWPPVPRQAPIRDSNGIPGPGGRPGVRSLCRVR